jgi:hypothetical protein
MSLVTEGRHAGAFILSEGPGAYSRDTITIKAGEGKLEPGSIVGKVAAALEASAAGIAGNAANVGALTLDATTPVLSGAAAGVYTVRCIAAAANSGTFRVTAPSGAVLGDVAVGATFANQIKFAIADGATDFSVGHGFDVTVVADTDATAIGKYRSADPTNTDGSGVAKAIIVHGVDATSVDVDVVAITRLAEVKGVALVYDAAVDNGAKKATKLAELAAVGIIAR